jgi:hypothetical protein
MLMITRRQGIAVDDDPVRGQQRKEGPDGRKGSYGAGQREHVRQVHRVEVAVRPGLWHIEVRAAVNIDQCGLRVGRGVASHQPNGHGAVTAEDQRNAISPQGRHNLVPVATRTTSLAF